MKTCLLDGIQITVSRTKKNRVAGYCRGRKNSANRQHLLQADYDVVVKIVGERCFIVRRAFFSFVNPDHSFWRLPSRNTRRAFAS